MRTDDQWFEPGDKVMRVAGNRPNGTPAPPELSPSIVPEYGRVYCVEDFWVGPEFNAVMLVGFGGWRYHPRNGTKVGWPASAFRKVEEIKLCISAVNRKREPNELQNA